MILEVEKFQVTNCPCNCKGVCTSFGKDNKVFYCKNVTRCVIKSHIIQTQALIDICQRGSAQYVGAMNIQNSWTLSGKIVHNDDPPLIE